MRFYFFLFCLLWLASLHASAHAAPLTAAEAAASAMSRHPRALAAMHDARAAHQGARAAGALTNPTIVFTPAITEGGADTELLIAQPLELNGTRAARSGAAKARARAADASVAADLRALAVEAKTAFYELARAREQLALSQDLLTSAQAFDRLTHTGVELGSRPAIDGTQSAIEVTRARQQVTLASAETERAQASLNVAMGRDAGAPIESLEALPVSFPVVETSALMAQAIETRADLTASEASAEALRQDARLARAEGRPDLAPQYRATSLTRGWRDAGVGVAITLPLLDYGDRQGRVRQSEELSKAQEARTEAIRSRIQLEVAQAISRVEAADTVLADYLQGLSAQAQSLLDASRIGYEEGKTGAADYLAAQRMFRAVRSDEINARIAAALARVEWEWATGAFAVPSLKDEKSK